MTERSVLSTFRAAVFAAVCTVLSVGVHTAEGHGSPPRWAVLVAFASAFGLARIGSVRERGLASISVLMVSLQAFLHVMFDAASRVAVDHQRVSGISAVMRAACHVDAPNAGMIVGHVLAALAASWWLRCGESAIYGLTRTLALRVEQALRLLASAVDAFPHVDLTDRLVCPSGGRLFAAAELLRFTGLRRGPPTGDVRP
ncbi:hypothetical protein [Catenulispora sp. MAP5-51]|uniref:hypothetical protein n=1 Tax=Catenulispora sp. MAP5-51 TaxID=3156298 RepID=UPI003519C8CD